ncbi:DUF4293 domain-containing protein [Flammeovirga pacifica]|uniref:Transcription termination factor Rho n=1 Tax=Flammeovirga pacifica TaxID=915059 RepID=A0A1S1Z3N8_FLAPC|nr:DUF4293 domain-containing protein [Flammeovirga pacifica]OHX67773.1 hypothetical protein NH26_16220 [Flammeovirga pacifica]
MIQRIQSIFLFLIVIGMFAVNFFPIWENETATLTATKLTYGDGEIVNTMVIAIVATISSLLALYSLLSFKDRMRQVKLNLINTLLIFITLGLMMYYGYYQGVELSGAQGEPNVGFFLPVFSIVLNRLAIKFIQKDEKKVKDSISGRLRD